MKSRVIIALLRNSGVLAGVFVTGKTFAGRATDCAHKTANIKIGVVARGVQHRLLELVRLLLEGRPPRK